MAARSLDLNQPKSFGMVIHVSVKSPRFDILIGTCGGSGMTDSNSADYYLRRRQRELELAQSATNSCAAAVHSELAARYGELLSASSIPVLHASKPQT